jgi:NADH-quinone oxidoreductase subunit C
MAIDLESVVSSLKSLVGDTALKFDRPLPNRVYITVGREDAREAGRKIFHELGEKHAARFVTATGSDIGEELEAVYHFSYDAVSLVINLRVRTPKAEATLPSLTPVVPAAEWIEREMSDLVGITFAGHPRPERLILADDWPEGVYPLRKDASNGA